MGTADSPEGKPKEVANAVAMTVRGMTPALVEGARKAMMGGAPVAPMAAAIAETSAVEVE